MITSLEIERYTVQQNLYGVMSYFPFSQTTRNEQG